MNGRNIAQISLTLTLVAAVIVAVLLLTDNTTALVIMATAYVVGFTASAIYVLWKRRTRRAMHKAPTRKG